MRHPDCETIMQAIQSLTHQIGEIEDRIGALEAEAMELNPLQYLVSQREVDRLYTVMQALQDKWNTTMNEFAICQSVYPAQDTFDRDHILLGR